MQRFWTKVAMGAIGVFVVGMFVVTLGRQGIQWARGLTHGDRVSIPLAFLPFNLDGERAGTLSGLEVNRQGAERGERVRIKVKMKNAAAARAMGECLIALDAENLGPASDFACLEAGELEAAEYQRVGEVVFEPGRVVRPLFLPADQVQRLRNRHEDRRREVTAKADFGDGDVRVAAASSLGETLQFQADEDGAFLVVRDGRGQKIVNLTADREGGVLTIRDGRGRSVVRVNADISRH